MTERRRAVTRDDVARQAGVSTAVVSYVVNNGPKAVAPPTAARVREAIRMLDYRPNPSARALRRGQTDILGLVLADADNPFYTEYASAIGAEAHRRGRALMIASARHDPGAESRLIDDLLGRQVDGIIAASSTLRPSTTLRRSDHGTKLVLLDETAPVPGYATVGLDGVPGAATAVQHLISVHGHRSIGIVLGDSPRGNVDPRKAGWRLALIAAGLPEGPVAEVSWTRDGGYEAGRRLLDLPDPPTAVFTCSDLLAVGLLRAAHERGLSVPGDLAIVSFDGTKESEFSWPALTVVAQPIPDMARAAVSYALSSERSGEHALFQGSLIVRRSCGCNPSP